MIKNALFLTVAVSFLCLSKLPSLGSEPSEAELEKLVSRSPKIYLPQLIALTHSKLEKEYITKLKSLPLEAREASKKSQVAWEAYYRADNEYGSLDVQGGSGQAVFAMERDLYQLRWRIYQIETPYLEGWTPIPKYQSAAIFIR